jgi:phenylacetate-CoA ligase
VLGRSSDLITSPAGKLLHGEFFTHLFYKLNGIYQFRVIQETHPDLHIQIVPGPGFDRQAAFTFLEEAIHLHGDPAFRVHFELRNHLPSAASGKYRFTVSYVPVTLN